MTSIPTTMTAHKLREIADWLDTYDKMAEQYIGVLCHPKDRAELLEDVRGKDVQNDLRAWADEIEMAPEDWKSRALLAEAERDAALHNAEEASLRAIEASNPGINIDEVRAFREYRKDGNWRRPELGVWPNCQCVQDESNDWWRCPEHGGPGKRKWPYG